MTTQVTLYFGGEQGEHERYHPDILCIGMEVGGQLTGHRTKTTRTKQMTLTWVALFGKWLTEDRPGRLPYAGKARDIGKMGLTRDD